MQEDIDHRQTSNTYWIRMLAFFHADAHILQAIMKECIHPRIFPVNGQLLVSIVQREIENAPAPSDVKK